jgi:hypothetical protein
MQGPAGTQLTCSSASLHMVNRRSAAARPAVLRTQGRRPSGVCSPTPPPRVPHVRLCPAKIHAHGQQQTWQLRVVCDIQALHSPCCPLAGMLPGKPQCDAGARPLPRSARPAGGQPGSPRFLATPERCKTPIDSHKKQGICEALKSLGDNSKSAPLLFSQQCGNGCPCHSPCQVSSAVSMATRHGGRAGGQAGDPAGRPEAGAVYPQASGR